MATVAPNLSIARVNWSSAMAFDVGSPRLATVTVRNQGGAAQVFVRGQVVMVNAPAKATPSVDSSWALVPAGGQQAFQVGPFTPPAIGEGSVSDQLMAELWWRNADGSGSWTKALGPVPAGDPFNVTELGASRQKSQPTSAPTPSAATGSQAVTPSNNTGLVLAAIAGVVGLWAWSRRGS